jgi:hypothetical protein
MSWTYYSTTTGDNPSGDLRVRAAEQQLIAIVSAIPRRCERASGRCRDSVEGRTRARQAMLTTTERVCVDVSSQANKRQTNTIVPQARGKCVWARSCHVSESARSNAVSKNIHSRGESAPNAVLV